MCTYISEKYVLNSKKYVPEIWGRQLERWIEGSANNRRCEMHDMHDYDW